MKKAIIVIILFTAANVFLGHAITTPSGFFGGADTVTVVQPEPFHPKVEQLISTILGRYHYKKTVLNDSLSSVILDNYIKTLDYNRYYFLESDIQSFEKYRHSFDDEFRDGDLNPPFEIFNVYKKRFNERSEFVNGLLEKDFDFTKDESYQIKREDAPWPKTAEEANELWRKRVKNDALNLKLTGKTPDEIRENLKKRYDNFQKAVNRYNSEEVFQLVMNSYSEAVDPHTNYLSPETSENFKISMSLSLEGIGASLQQEGDFTKVAEVIAGGPAYKSRLLHRDDRIIGVAQGEDGEMVDVIGWRLSDVVQLIRGAKGTKVRLQVLPAADGANAIAKEIIIVRDKVKLEEQAAKKEIIDMKQAGRDFKIGVITIPAFYSDFEAQQKGIKDYKSTTRDVRLLLDTLDREGVDGVVIDLRNNGGGSLQEAIQLTGLFIKEGPVVQVRNADGSVDVGEDPDPQIVYDGPLAVLVNRFSASASEIFSGAIQDYGRGLIIGEQTFGKGTVQNLIDLNRLMPSASEKFGQLKLTIAKYYRVDGGSTQHKGVVPDIAYPSAFDPKEFGESSEPSALPWDQISSSSFKKFGDLNGIIPELEKKHKQRVSDDPEFDYLLQDIEDYKESREKEFVSLNEEVRKREKEEADDKNFKRENERRSLKGLKLLKKGETPPEEEKSETDPLLKETANILADYIGTIG